MLVVFLQRLTVIYNLKILYYMEVKIRPLKIEDAYTSVKWRNDSEVFKYTGNTYNHEITIDSELEWISKVISKTTDYRCAILADDTYVGNIYLTDIDNYTATYHIFIGERDYWGKGIAKAASLLLIGYGFDKLSLKTIRLKVRRPNIAAIRLYNSLGFETIATDKDFFYMRIEKQRFFENLK